MRRIYILHRRGRDRKQSRPEDIRANMQWSLFLLLMGPCLFFARRNYVYHYIDQEMTWEEAQKFCRENYTDLAMVYDQTDMTRLCASTNSHRDAWMGLYTESVETFELMGGNAKCDDDKCKKTGRFLHCKENIKPAKYYFCGKKKTLPMDHGSFRSQCTDLLSGVSQLNCTRFTFQTDCNQLHPSVSRLCQTTDNLPRNQCWLISLFRDNWKWSDGSSLSFRNWGDECMQTDPNGKLCAVTILDKNGRWKEADCRKKKHFFCYDETMILIKENKTWEEALDYCRENHIDLVSITDSHQQKRVEEIAKNALTPFVWLGLHYSCFLDMWLWVGDQLVCYENWGSAGKQDQCNMTGALEKGHHRWCSRKMNSKFNFICT